MGCRCGAKSARSRRLSAAATQKATAKATRLANAGIKIQPKKPTAKKIPPKKPAPCKCVGEP